MNRPGGDPVTRRTFWDLKNQQQAMSVAFFFMMMFVLLSGLFTSIERMPTWAKVIAYCNPVTYFIAVIRLIILKGSGFKDLLLHIFSDNSDGIFFQYVGSCSLQKKRTNKPKNNLAKGGILLLFKLGAV